MVSWILAGLVIIALIVFFKTTGVRFGKTWTFLIGVLILFFVLSFGYVMIQVGEVNTLDGLVGTVRVYFGWLGSFLDNAASITGEVTSIDWEANVTG